MGKFISNFNTTPQFSLFSGTSECLTPHVSYTKDNRQSHFLDSYNGHEYVEIGGIKWATMNIGATGVTDYGLYFQYGDTHGYTKEQVGSGEGKKYFGLNDYKFYTIDTSQEGESYQGGKITKYNSVDKKRQLELEDDAARANWGGDWRIPTRAEFIVLSNSVTSAWTSSYEGSGVAGLVLTDKTDETKKLFFPAAGYALNGKYGDINVNGRNWSSSMANSDGPNAYFIGFESSGVNWQQYKGRWYGRVVRGVFG